MKSILILFAMAGTASAQAQHYDLAAQRTYYGHTSADQPTPQQRCFRDAPWIVPKDYYLNCIAAQRESDKLDRDIGRRR